MQLIPKIIHQIWLGSQPLPPHLKPWMASWKQHFPSWEYRLWTDQELRQIKDTLVCRHVFDHKQSLALLSDVLRMEILNRYGGMYMDCDFECLHPFETFLQDGCFHYGDEKLGQPCNAWLCSAPNHRLLALYLDQLRHAITGPVDHHKDWFAVVSKTGPQALRRVLNFWVGEWAGKEITLGENVGTIYPGLVVGYRRETLYPYFLDEHTWHEFSRKRYPKALAVHHWEGTWRW